MCIKGMKNEREIGALSRWRPGHHPSISMKHQHVEGLAWPELLAGWALPTARPTGVLVLGSVVWQRGGGGAKGGVRVGLHWGVAERGMAGRNKQATGSSSPPAPIWTTHRVQP